ncbi:ATP-binding protein [Desulfopila sp. IMCC35006]|uniref:ATP-binding protein n=1 Tax=Desulfopila sp. IMCC35006 TaxID=2569542 RepID=UPI0010ACCB80|nr:P-loop NTPase [Desulfopila sp. IMCC35006]TKB28050.1 ATP-binding protein [Desulfopila sp. IMCC35006]
MKIMICGKGGCGKSTLTVLLARALAGIGKKVLVVDADESNLCLHRLLGIHQPEIMMDAMGGRIGTREKLKQASDHQHEDDFFKQVMTFDNLPAECVTEADGIKLLVVGKIKEFGEGCACMIGGISKAVLSRLQEKENEIVLIDAEAGLEHFGRQIDKSCDLVLCVVDPNYESIQMADRARQIAEGAGVQTYFILNKVDDNVREIMTSNLESQRIIAAIPHNEEIFLQSLTGQTLTAGMPQIEAACTFITSYRKPLSLNMKM